MAFDFAALFPDQPEPSTGPGVSYCVAPNALMFDYEIRLPGQHRLKGCLRAIDKKDAERILINRHPQAEILELGKGRKIISTPHHKTK